MKEILKKNQAITLVSLVVTIIILIILAGVSLNFTLGQNGIITKAKQAKENTELAKIEEETRLNELYLQMESEGGITGDISYDAIAKLVEFKREIASAISDMGITTAENADASTMASNIRSLSGASSADKVSYDNTNSGLTATNVQGAIDEVNNSFQSEVVTIYSGVTLIRCGKIRTLSIVNPTTITSNTFNLPLETDCPSVEINAMGRRDSSANIGLIIVSPKGNVNHIQISGSTANFNSSSRYTATWIVE